MILVRSDRPKAKSALKLLPTERERERERESASINTQANHPLPPHATDQQQTMRLLYSFPRPRISLRYIWPWSWAVTAPKKMVAMAKKEAELVNGGEPQGTFESANRPPFKIGDVRAAIPSHCWVKDKWRSMSYVLRDVVVIAALALAAGHLNSWIFWHVYWLAQGTMFWAIFVLGHDWYSIIPLSSTLALL